MLEIEGVLRWACILPIRYLEKRNRHGQCHNARRLVWFHVPWQLDRYLPRICSSILPCWVYTRFCLDRLVMGLHQAVAALPIRDLAPSSWSCKGMDL